MIILYFPGGPPSEWLAGFLRRADAVFLRAFEAARDAAAFLRAEGRRRWPELRERLRLREDGLDGRAARLLASVRSWVARVAGRARPLGAQLAAWARPRMARLAAGTRAGIGRSRVVARAGARRVRAAVRLGAARFGPRLRVVAGAVRLRPPSRREAVALAGVVAVAAAVGGGVLWERCGFSGCPDVERLSSYQPAGTSVVLDRNGVEFATLALMEYEVVALDSLPPYVAEAFVAVEDRRFFQHRGVDWGRAVGALFADVREGRLAQGASTIPMQLSRTLFPDRIRREEKTFRRKLLEVRVAGEIEERFTKREILELYLNHVYLGGGSYGVQAASRYYFGKPATELMVDEAALLAAMPRAPSHYDPRRRPEAARARRDLVLTLMERQGLMPFREAQEARERELAVTEEPDRDRDGDRLAPYFVEEVRRQLADALGERLYEAPLRIVTTLDVFAQEAAEAELEAQLRSVERGWFGRYTAPRYGAADDGSSRTGDDGAAGATRAAGTPYLQGAVVLMDARTGDIRAWVGGRDHDDSRFDRAQLARRQAGSAFKPFVYAAALEDGLSPSQPILDAPYRLARAGSPEWRPGNYSGGFEGPMSMRQALVRSQNVPAVRLAAAVGDDRIRDVAARLGLRGEVPASPVAALGVTAVSPLEMTTAFASFATLGERPDPHFVLRVEAEDGRVLWANEPAPPTRVMDRDVAYLLTDMLRDVVDRGTGASVRHVGYWGPAAGKTGTTSDATDVWFVGYTPELVATVWVGFDEVKPLPRGATGGGIAAPAWGRMMARVHTGRAAPDWPARPRGILALRVDPDTGMALDERCYPRWGDARRELFLERAAPATSCPRRWERGRFGRWWGSTFDRDRFPRIPARTDPDLGMPRLPTRDG